jgi:ribose transport system ATP-binding protein
MEYQERQVGGEVLLEARGLTTATKLRGIDFQLHEGEVLGLAGLMGSGRTELARALFGIDPVQSGDLLLEGLPIRIPNPRVAIAHGVALIPEDRRVQGLILDHSVRENFLLPLLGRLSRAGFVDDAEGERRTDSFVTRLSIKTRSTKQPIRTLSGGNQQKVVISKWLMSKPKVLIMDDPTRGIDVGAKYEIYKLMNDLTEQGISIIMISSELEEVLGMSDRVMVMHEGRSTSTLNIADATQEKIMALATGIA